MEMKTVIGFSLPYKLFMEQPPDGNQHCLLNQYNSVEYLLNRLKAAGVASIEIRVLPRDGDSAQIQNTVQMVWEMGFQLTVHGALQGNATGNNFADIYPSMKYIMDHYHRYQNELIVTVHALHDIENENNKSETVIGSLAERTVNQLTEWADMTRMTHPSIQFALEINRRKSPLIDPGDTVEGVLHMVDAINRPNVGICWDMGHYYANLLAMHQLPEPPEQWIEELPPEAFLNRVVHTHIHGLSGREETHFPLTARKSLPLEHYVQSLMQVNYRGGFNLELTFHKWPNRLEEGIFSSILRLSRLSS